VSLLRRAAFDGLLFTTNYLVAHVPSHSVRLLYYRRVLGFEIGDHSYIFMGAWFQGRRGFRMGSNSVINERCRLDNRGSLRIGRNVSISPEVCLITADHDLRSRDFVGRERPIVIDDYAFVGTRATILPGVTIGEGAAVAAGAVVATDVPPYTIVAGVPAQPIGTRNKDLRYELSYGRLFS
jgi:acetyltransferase-like isoleucine patch superfamily enzyme